jgi:hypothetical protein
MLFIFSRPFSEYFPHPKKIQRHNIIFNVHGFPCNVPFWYTLIKLQYSRQLLGKPRIIFQENLFIWSHFVAWVKIHGRKNKERQTI